MAVPLQHPVEIFHKRAWRLGQRKKPDRQETLSLAIRPKTLKTQGRILQLSEIALMLATLQGSG
jgi:hypothetical protein